jgi:hypothetical protein
MILKGEVRDGQQLLVGVDPQGALTFAPAVEKATAR